MNLQTESGVVVTGEEKKTKIQENFRREKRVNKEKPEHQRAVLVKNIGLDLTYPEQQLAWTATMPSCC